MPGNAKIFDTFDGAQVPPCRAGKWFDATQHPELVEGEALLRINPEQIPAFRPAGRKVDNPALERALRQSCSLRFFARSRV